MWVEGDKLILNFFTRAVEPTSRCSVHSVQYVLNASTSAFWSSKLLEILVLGVICTN